jgi:hypothetical protein
VAHLAIFTGRREIATRVLEDAKRKRFSKIANDGSQPQELQPTKSFSYSVFNLRALCALAKLGEETGIDL